MAFLAAVGQSQDFAENRAGYQATQMALDRLGRAKVSFGWVIFSHVFSSQKLLAGIADLLGDVPLIGFSTTGELTIRGMSQRSVVVLLFSGDDIQARAGWWPDFIDDGHNCTRQLLNALLPVGEDILLVVADGFSEDTDYLCQVTSDRNLSMTGCLAGGNTGDGLTRQIGGWQSGSGGLAGVLISGNIKMGVGAAHGWQPIGALSRLTSVHDSWVREIDRKPASETFARLFGYPAQEWSLPPLKDMVRLYPFGITDHLVNYLRSPVRMEADGSLRMNAHLPENVLVDFMIGSPEKCLEAARLAARNAKGALEPAHPRAGLVLVDCAWQTLLELQPGAEIQAVSEEIGEQIPMAGGYTFGQIARLPDHNRVRFLNQHIVVILFSEVG